MNDVFTPLNEQRTERLHFMQSQVKVLDGTLDKRGYGYHATVEVNGKKYKVYGTACSLPACACDAFIREIN